MKTIKREPPHSLEAVRNRPTHRAECTRPLWAIIVGGADCVWDDIQQSTFGLLSASWPGLIIAANDIGCHLPVVDHWATFHISKLMGWLQARENKGLPRPGATWGWRIDQPVDFVLYPWSGGSSGMLAAQVAYALGCEKIILCGIPMTATPHFSESTEFDPAHTVWSEAEMHWRNWRRVHELGWFEGKLRSMSGRTRELFGEPTWGWLFT